MPPLRTLRLRERQTSRCRLGRDDVDYLLRHHRRHIEVEPDERPWVRLTPRGYVGVLHTPGCRLVLRPKVPLRTLAFLLDLPPESLQGQGEASPDGGVIHDALALRLAGLMRERYAAGLHRDYREEPHSGPMLRGKLDVAAQQREAARGGAQLHMHTNAHGADVPVNQVPRFTAERLRSWRGLSPGAQDALGRALAGWEDISPTDPGEQRLGQLLLSPLPPGYVPLLQCCRLILEALGPGWQSGVTGPALLLDLERAFERTLTRSLVEAFADGSHAVRVQTWHSACPAGERQPGLTFRPDIVLGPAARPLIVVDAKWKNLSPTALPIDDVHQALAYSLALGARRAVLVYPTRVDHRWAYTFPGSDVILEVCGVGLWGDADRCRRSLARLGRRLKEACREEFPIDTKE